MNNTDQTVDAPLTRQKTVHFRVSAQSIGVSFRNICGASYDPAHSTKATGRVTCKKCMKSALFCSINNDKKD